MFSRMVILRGRLGRKAKRQEIDPAGIWRGRGCAEAPGAVWRCKRRRRSRWPCMCGTRSAHGLASFGAGFARPAFNVKRSKTPDATYTLHALTHHILLHTLHPESSSPASLALAPSPLPPLVRVPPVVIHTAKTPGKSKGKSKPTNTKVATRSVLFLSPTPNQYQHTWHRPPILPRHAAFIPADAKIHPPPRPPANQRPRSEKPRLFLHEHRC